MSPLFAVFLTQQIEGGNMELIGLCTAVNLILRSSLQIPFSRFIDRHKGEIDDFVVMFIGSMLTSLSPFLYILATKSTHILLIQGLLGIGGSMASPGWLAIFTRHIDQHREAEEWGLYNAMVGLSGALTGALGGFMTERFGFRFMYFVVGVVCTFGSAFLFFVYQDLREAEKKAKS